MEEEKHDAVEEKEQEYFNIYIYPHKALRTKAVEIAPFDTSPHWLKVEIQEIINKMIETMYRAEGLGLAATQVGLHESILVYDTEQIKGERHPAVLINPRLVEFSGETISEQEGCLSVIGYRADVKRYESIVVEGIGRGGMPMRVEADGRLAITLQHELDHLNGKLFIDHLSKLKRDMYTRKLKKALRRHRGADDGY